MRDRNQRASCLKLYGKCVREVGLVVPTTYSAFTKCKKTAEILEKELERRKQIFSQYNLTIKRSEKVAFTFVRVQNTTFNKIVCLFFVFF